MSTDIWVWIMAVVTIGIFSFVIKENPFYRLCEHIFVGAATAYGISVAYQNIKEQAWNPIVQDGKFIYIIPVIFGLLAYARFFKGVAWLARYPMGLLAGIGAGVSLFGITNSDLINQIRANLLPLNSVNNVIMVLGVLSILIYFFFAIEHKGPIMHVSVLGRYLLMITFGVSFGNVVMGRLQLLLGSLQDLLGTWLGII